jgi:hypothetical protein
MVTHDGVTAGLDGEDGSELFEAIANPALAVFAIAAGDQMLAAKKRPANTASDAMIDAVLVTGHDFTAWVGRLQRVSWGKELCTAMLSVRKTTCGQTYR